MFFRKENNELQNNVEYATYGIERFRQIYPYGGLNRRDVKNSLDEKLHQHQLLCITVYRKTTEAFKKGTATTLDFQMMLESFEQLNGVFCREASHVIKYEIEKKYPNANVESVALEGGCHAMLVIGRLENSNPFEIETWGENAIICDAWAGTMYKASDFHLKKEQGKDITHFGVITTRDNVTGKFKREYRDMKQHYLTGKPIIYSDISLEEKMVLDTIRSRNN